MNAITGLISAALLCATGGAFAADYIAGIDIGPQYEARVRSDIERYRKSDAKIVVTNHSGVEISGAKVSIRQVSSDFLFGCAFPMWSAPPEGLGKDGWANWEKYFTHLFNYATTENSIKWTPLEPEEGKFRWESADFIAKWCKEHHILLKGHNLVWALENGGAPAWVYKYPPQKIGELVHQRINAVMGRYKNDIPIWDVVNEPVHLHKLETAWDPDYVLLSYKWAREADPKAALVINEYSAFTGIGNKYTQYVKDLLKRGAPIDVIAEQAHDVPHWYSPKQILGTLDKMAATNLDIHLTELTYPSDGRDITGGFMQGKWTEEKQAEFYKYLLTLAFSHPNVKAITLWAFWDGSTWIKNGGLVRKDWTPKPAYKVCDDLINNQWRTRLDMRTDMSGEAGFRGFNGMYEITVTAPDGNRKTVSLHVYPKISNTLNVVIDN